MNTDNLTTTDGVKQTEQIKALQAALRLQVEQTQAAIAEIEPLILAVQEEKQEANAVESLMLRNVQVAEDTHTALARTVEEKRITSQGTNTGVSLASRSAVPTAPVGPRKFLIAAAAAAGIIFLFLLLIIFIVWWGTDITPSSSPEAEAGTSDQPLTAPEHGS